MQNVFYYSNTNRKACPTTDIENKKKKHPKICIIILFPFSPLLVTLRSLFCVRYFLGYYLLTYLCM